MKKLLLFISILSFFLNGFSQNAPVAVGDTIYVDFNDSISMRAPGGGSSFLINDSDPDGDYFFIDTATYNGAGIYSQTFTNLTPTFRKWVFSYQPPLNYVGLDSIQYIIADDEIPANYDTAIIYLFVKHAEFEQLDLNNINARFSLFTLFHDDDNGITAFEVPKASGANTIFAANLWTSGKNQDSVYLNGETFGTTWTGTYFSGFDKRFEFKSPAGPVMDSVYYNLTDYDYQWDRLWKVNNSDLVYHIANWNVNGYQPAEVIKNWPAHGDVAKGQAYYLAPFVDNNNDGVYNPLDGDYPKIKGQQAIYYIYNDIRWQGITQKPMKTEVHYMAYAYHCPSDSALYNTIFIDYTIYNRSNLTYDSTYVGMWTDFDIGYSGDDFVACDVARSTFYGYNGDDNDDYSNPSGAPGYGVYPPAQGVTFLQGAKQDNDGLDNPLTTNLQDVVDSNGTPYAGLGTGFGDGVVDNEHWGMEHFMYYNVGSGAFPGDGDPQSNSDFHIYLKGFWRDGSQLVYGGNGNSASTGGTVKTKHIFPGDSDPLWYGTNGVVSTPANWNEISAGNAPGDRRGVGSTGPFTFEPDSSVSITLAFVFGRDYQTTGAQAGVVVMQERIDSIRNYFNSDFVSACNGSAPVTVKENANKNDALKVYPNPFNNELTVNYKLKENTATLTIYNIIGENIYSAILNQNSTQLSLTNFDKGIYFIKIIDGDNYVTQKIVKQ